MSDTKIFGLEKKDYEYMWKEKITDKELVKLYKGDVKAKEKAMKELTGNFKGTMTPRKAKKMLKKYNK